MTPKPKVNFVTDTGLVSALQETKVLEGLGLDESLNTYWTKVKDTFPESKSHDNPITDNGYQDTPFYALSTQKHPFREAMVSLAEALTEEREQQAQDHEELRVDSSHTSQIAKFNRRLEASKQRQSNR
jgi:hypothetical protein